MNTRVLSQVTENWVRLLFLYAYLVDNALTEPRYGVKLCEASDEGGDVLSGYNLKLKCFTLVTKLCYRQVS